MAETYTIAVLGAGLMGHGIALTFARAGHAVRVHDPFPASLDALHKRVRASLEAMAVPDPEIAETLERISPQRDLPDARSRRPTSSSRPPRKSRT